MTTYPALKPRILATDLDHTIVSEEVPHTTLWDALPLQQTSLIYITGRHKQSALQLIEDQQLPMPTILLCDVGASIYYGPQLELDQQWAEKNKVMHAERINEIAASLHIRPQPIDPTWRQAFYADPQQMQAFRKSLQDEDIAVELIYSSERDVDILPQHVNKGAALQFVLAKTHYNGEVVVAGDSENDLSLFQLGLPAIAVGNACAAIVEMASADHIHLASQHAAAGVKEIWEQLFFKDEAE